MPTGHSVGIFLYFCGPMKKTTLFLLVLLCFSVAAFAQRQSSFNRFASFSGHIDTQYTYDEGSNTFSLKRVRLAVTGEPVPGLEYRLQADMAGSASKILDAFLRYRFNPFLNIQAGQFTTPFTLESQYSLLKKEGIDYAQAISRLSGYNDVISERNSNGRDIGVMVYGNLFEVGENPYPIIKYNIGIFNGAGINRVDVNRAKDIIARVDVHPYVRNLVLSASVVAGSYDNGVNANAANNRFSVGGEYKDDALTIRSEYVRAHIDNGGEKLSYDGYYAVAGYWFDLTDSSRLRPIVRYDTFNDAGVVTTLYMAGVDYWPLAHLRLQLGYTHSYAPQSSAHRNILQAMVSVSY